tara:strand:+ start:919 stop:1413 length:495 start_codon:yes stop_codon:yes gene_type:complete
MLNKKIIDLINEQIWLENNASFYYLHLSIQFSINGFGGISNFFKEQSEEEREHMIKLIEYLLDEDVTPNIPNYNFMEDMDEKFNIINYFENSLLSEKRVSESVHKIVSKCKEIGDIKTENFMQWFVTEQMEEENKFKSIIDDLKIIGDDRNGLYHFNKEMGDIN